MLPSWRNIASKVRHVFCFCFFRRFCRRGIRVFSRFPWSPSVTQKYCRKRLVWYSLYPPEEESTVFYLLELFYIFLPASVHCTLQSPYWMKLFLDANTVYARHPSFPMSVSSHAQPLLSVLVLVGFECF